MTDIVAFLTARLDEDEALAELQAPWPWRVGDDPTEVIAKDEVEVATAFALSGNQQRNTATFIARHDPARVLREAAAKRAIAELHEMSSRPERWGDLRWPPEADSSAARQRAYGKPTGNTIYSCETCDGFDREEERLVRAEPWCDTLRALVAVYADHPDYDSSWAS